MQSSVHVASNNRAPMLNNRDVSGALNSNLAGCCVRPGVLLGARVVFV
jgi:hypothetical protein